MGKHTTYMGWFEPRYAKSRALAGFQRYTIFSNGLEDSQLARSSWALHKPKFHGLDQLCQTQHLNGLLMSLGIVKAHHWAGSEGTKNLKRAGTGQYLRPMITSKHEMRSNT